MIGKASVRGAALLAVAAVVLAGCGDSGSDDNNAAAQAGALEGRGPIKFATGKDTSGNMQKLVDSGTASTPTRR